jgi:hypothetical protein
MRAVALSSLLAAGCLSTPAPAASDAGPPDAADPCPADDCTQLLAVGLRGYDVTPDNGPGWVIYQRVPGGDWSLVAESQGPDWNVNDVDWGDCCGPTGGPDGVPDLLAASWYGPWVQQVDLIEGAVVVRPYVDLYADDTADEEAHAEFVDLDGDLDLDVITGQPRLHVYRNDAPGWTYEMPDIEEHSERVAVGNWDDDAEPEVAVVDRRVVEEGGLGVRVREDDDSWVPIDDSVRLTNAIWCDLTGGPELDLLATDAYQSMLYPNRGEEVGGSWLDAGAAISFGAIGMDDPATACGDVDADGDQDLLVATSQGIRIILHGATSHLPAYSVEAIDHADDDVEGIELGDVDGDGYPELFVALDNYDEDIPVVYQLANRTGAGGGISFGDPTPLHSQTTAALAVAFIELAPAR